MTAPALYRNKKNGRFYRALFRALDATNERNGSLVMVYEDDTTKAPYVRDLQEFNEKFEEVEG